MTIPRTSKSRVAARRAKFPPHLVEGRGWPEEPRAICGAPSSDLDVAVGRVTSGGDLHHLRFRHLHFCVECIRELEQLS